MISIKSVSDNYRQKEMAQKIFGYGFQTETINSQGWELKLLALYLRDECGMKPAQIREYLENFCSKYANGYHYRAYYRVLDAATRFAADRTNALIQIDAIDATKGEIDYIDGLDIPYDHKKVMFSLMMLKKLDALCYEQRHDGEVYKSGYFPADGEKMRTLKRVSGISAKISIPKDIFFVWREKELIRVTCSGFILDFMDSIPESGERVVSMEHFDSFGAYWDLMHKPEKMTECAVCGKPIRKTSNNRIYCADHAAFRGGNALHATKKMECEHCGREFYVSAHAVKTRLCPPCARGL